MHRSDRWSRTTRFAAALSGRQALTACVAVVDGARVVLTLKQRGLRPLLRDRPVIRRVDPAAARQLAEAVDAGLGMLPVAPTCLRRSVTLLRELDRRGLEARLCIGVRSVDGAIEAHAWVQVADDVVNDDPDHIRTYQPISVGEAERILPRLR